MNKNPRAIFEVFLLYLQKYWTEIRENQCGTYLSIGIEFN